MAVHARKKIIVLTVPSKGSLKALCENNIPLCNSFFKSVCAISDTNDFCTLCAIRSFPMNFKCQD